MRAAFSIHDKNAAFKVMKLFGKLAIGKLRLKTHPESSVELATEQKLVMEEQFVGVAIVEVVEVNNVVVSRAVRKKTVRR